MNGLEPTTVTHELTGHLMVPEDDSVALPVVFRYDTADPYAVNATFRTGQGDGVSWVFARELLTLGVHRPAGEGDVQVWPSWSADSVWPSWSAASKVIYIGLGSPNGEAVLQAPTREVLDFLDCSYSLCPQGQEGEHLDVDGAIEALLAV